MSEHHREMMTCGRDFDETWLTGFLDAALTQADEQRVRLHLEDCTACRELVRDMRSIREATMTTTFKLPPDDAWSEKPRGAVSRTAFGLGWLLVIAWAVGLSGFALGQLWTGPQTVIEKLLVFGGVSGMALLFLSVLIDRLFGLKDDRYRRVQK